MAKEKTLREKIRDGANRYWASPESEEHRKRLSKAMKKVWREEAAKNKVYIPKGIIKEEDQNARS